MMMLVVSEIIISLSLMNFFFFNLIVFLEMMFQKLEGFQRITADMNTALVSLL